jgi:GDP-D-mannose 3',5'-epimerase
VSDGKTLVAGAGGFIGGHLVTALTADGAEVRAVDVKPVECWFQRFDDVENVKLDLRDREQCDRAVAGGVTQIYNLAADMGGMGFIETNKALCMLSVLINTQLLEAARENDVPRFFFASSACVYPEGRQGSPEVAPLREDDAYPAMPEDGYGWEKLFSERMCRHFAEDFGMQTRVARYHNVYGPYGTFEGGREKAPAAICRKVAKAELSGEHVIEVWGDGEQTRSFTYIDDCIFGTRALMDSDVDEPLNIGSSELVTINALIDRVERIAGISVERRYDLTAPQGVRGRNSDNTRIQEKLGWAPSIPLDEGLERTYGWIRDQIANRVVA